MAGQVFVNYRRDDSFSQALNIAQSLSTELGKKNVFFDIANLGAGQNFTKVLDERLSSCGVMISVIGPQWIDARDAQGRRRLDNDDDWVRLELSRAIARGIPVIPVLVSGARLPAKNDLPPDLRPLLDHHSTSVGTNSFINDMAGLVKDLRSLNVGQTQQGQAGRPLRIAAGAAVIVFVSAITAYFLLASAVTEKQATGPSSTSSNLPPSAPADGKAINKLAGLEVPFRRPAEPIVPKPPDPACALTASFAGTDEAGRAGFSLMSSCGSVETYDIEYLGWRFRRVAPVNRTKFPVTLDLFAGPAPVTFIADNGARSVIEATMPNASAILKLALVWTTKADQPVDLDLHVLHRGVSIGEDGDVWADRTPSLFQASTGQTGFLSMSDDGRLPGDHVEVYTFLKTGSQRAARLQPAVDFKSRGDLASPPYCGSNPLARVDYQVLKFENGRLETPPYHRGFFPKAECGAQFTKQSRYISAGSTIRF